MQKHHRILLIVLLLAVAAYFSGFFLGSVVLIAIGMVLEGAFWVQLLRRKGHKR